MQQPTGANGARIKSLLSHTRRILARLVWVFALAFFAVWILTHPGNIQAQDIPTSTPDAEGNIYVVVQPNDSFWGIAARAGLTIEELLTLNELQENAVLQPGDILLIGHVTPPATPTSDIPTPTLAPPTPTETILPPRTAVCLLAYNDLDQNSMYEPGEPLWPNVAFTLFNDQLVVANYITDGVSEPYCLENIEPGTYHVTRSIARDETLTTEGDWAMTVSSGNVLNLAFGSYRAGSGSGVETPDADAQLATRIALTPVASPTAVQQEEISGLASLPWTALCLGGAIIVLLIGMAVLIFLIAKMRIKQTSTLVENENEKNN